MHAAAARHAAATKKDDQAEAELRVAVQEEAQKQAETVDTVTQDVMRAKGVSLAHSEHPHEDEKLVCARPTTSAHFCTSNKYLVLFPSLSVVAKRPCLAIWIWYTGTVGIETTMGRSPIRAPETLHSEAHG